MDTVRDSYSVGQWHGMPRYQCLLCRFDSLDRAVIEKHIQTVHKTTMPASGRVLDARGKPITELPVPETAYAYEVTLAEWSEEGEDDDGSVGCDSTEPSGEVSGDAVGSR